MDVGIEVSGALAWSRARDVWRAVDPLPYCSAWMFDHLAWRGRPGGFWLGAVPALAAAGELTQRIRLGTLVSSPNFRHPLPFAQEIASLDHMTGGRLTVGLGAGVRNAESRAAGGEVLSVDQRQGRFVEFVTVLHDLLSVGTGRFEGNYYVVRPLDFELTCVQRPRVPFVIAGTSEASMQLACSFGTGWVTNGSAPRAGLSAPRSSPEVVGPQLAALREVCQGARRPDAPLRRIALLTGSERDVLASPRRLLRTAWAYRQLGVEELVLSVPIDATAGDIVSTLEAAAPAVATIKSW